MRTNFSELICNRENKPTKIYMLIICRACHIAKIKYFAKQLFPLFLPSPGWGGGGGLINLNVPVGYFMRNEQLSGVEMQSCPKFGTFKKLRRELAQIIFT